MSFENRVAIVTGAASGIGRALSAELTRRGAVVVGADIQFDGRDPAAVRLDVRDAEGVRKLVDTTIRAHGRLDFMFNNAGIGVSGEMRDLTLDDWRTVID